MEECLQDDKTDNSDWKVNETSEIYVFLHSVMILFVLINNKSVNIVFQDEEVELEEDNIQERLGNSANEQEFSEEETHFLGRGRITKW